MAKRKKHETSPPPPTKKTDRPRRKPRRGPPPSAPLSDHDRRKLLQQVEPALKPMVVRAAQGLNCSADESDLDDVVQDILIRLWTDDLLRYDPRQGNIFGFVRQRVFSSVREHHKKQGRRPEVGFDVDKHDARVDCIDDQLDDLTWSAMETTLVDDIKETLSPLEAAAVLTATRSAEFPKVAEVAKQFGVSTTAVYEARKEGLSTMERHLTKTWGLK